MLSHNLGNARINKYVLKQIRCLEFPLLFPWEDNLTYCSQRWTVFCNVSLILWSSIYSVTHITKVWSMLLQFVSLYEMYILGSDVCRCPVYKVPVRLGYIPQFIHTACTDSCVHHRGWSLYCHVDWHCTSCHHHCWHCCNHNHMWVNLASMCVIIFLHEVWSFFPNMACFQI